MSDVSKSRAIGSRDTSKTIRTASRVGSSSKATETRAASKRGATSSREYSSTILIENLVVSSSIATGIQDANRVGATWVAGVVRAETIRTTSTTEAADETVMMTTVDADGHVVAMTMTTAVGEETEIATGSSLGASELTLATVITASIEVIRSDRAIMNAGTADAGMTAVTQTMIDTMITRRITA